MTRRIVNSGKPYPALWTFPAQVLAAVEPGLFLDVGAAVGAKVREMLKASPLSRVIAYEPFPGNLVHLHRHWDSDPRVKIRAAAVGDRRGEAGFVVPALIDSRLPGWNAMAGASTVGHLAHGPQTIHSTKVPVVTLSDEIAEHVRFLKIDVQGGERAVLDGARRLIETHGIDMIYVEFSGSLRVLQRLHETGYTVFDCIYLAWPTRRYFRNFFRRRRDFVFPAWPAAATGKLSTGQKAAHIWPPVPFRSFALYCGWFFLTRLFRTGLQTDLLCIHRDYLETFLRSVSAESASTRVGPAPDA